MQLKLRWVGRKVLTEWVMVRIRQQLNCLGIRRKRFRSDKAFEVLMVATSAVFFSLSFISDVLGISTNVSLLAVRFMCDCDIFLVQLLRSSSLRASRNN